MDLRVYHPTFISMTVTLPSNRTVLFDEYGISPELSREEYDLLLTCRDFVSLGDLEKSLWDEAAQDALPLAGEVPAWVLTADLPPLAPGDEFVVGLSEPEAIPAHDPDASLLDQFRTGVDCRAFFENLKLTDRLDLASDHRLTETEAALMFDWETAGRKSKRIQTALDRRLVLVRGSKTAEKVTAGLLAANFPRLEES